MQEFLRQLHPAARFVGERHLRRLLGDHIANGARVPLNTDLPLWHENELLITPPDDRGLYHCDDTALRRIYSPLVAYTVALQSRDVTRWEAMTEPQRREARTVLGSENRLPANPSEDEVAIATCAWLSVLSDGEIADTFPLMGPSPPTASVGSPQTSDFIVAVSPLTPSVGLGRNYIREILADDRAAFEAFTAALEPVLEDVREALAPLILAAKASAWPHEKRALYDLQRLLTDRAGTLYAVMPVEWLTSLGRVPLRRSLEPVRDVILMRRLRSVAQHLQRSNLNGDDRHAIETLVDAAIERTERVIRDTIRPVIHAVFDDVGHVPTLLQERIGRDASVEELLDRLCETGFLRLADVRDAVARNQLKLPDITSGPDPLLAADRQLHERLFGVYHRGEIYLRAIQRFSSVAFGTPVGRFLTLFVALPYGGAFLAIEAAKHLAHAFTALFALVFPPATNREKTHHAAIDDRTLMAAAVFGTLTLLVINFPLVRRYTFLFVSQFQKLARFLILTIPSALVATPLAKTLLDNAVLRAVNAYVLLPAILSSLLLLALILMGVHTQGAAMVSLATFLTAVFLSSTPWGAELQEDVAETAHDLGRRVVSEFLPGLIRWVLWLFHEALSMLERILYAIDEWFRYRQGQSQPSLVMKATLALLWFPIAYVLRFAFYLLLEPQVNPIKHFPVVTVSHKVLLPLIPSVASALQVSDGTAGLLVSGVPGIFGFLVWEFKENWKLYAANRANAVPAAVIGHHGETVRSYLRPGFHSGTVPKLFRHLRRWGQEANPSPRRRDRLDHERHYIEESLRRLVERHLVAYAGGRREASIHLGVQRVEISVEDLRLALEYRDNTIIGTVESWGWAIGEQELLKRFFHTAAAETVL